ncbi:MAG: BMP family ABC transporter substrate-binding protein [Verrucomicrobiia bacterium]
MRVKHRLWRWMIVVSLIVAATMPAQADEQKLKAAWIYVSPVGDMGFTSGHDQARKNLAAKFPWLTTVYAEAVPESDVDRFLARYVVEQNVDVVFTCSFGFMDGTIAAAKKFPNKMFFHCAGFKREPNSGNYWGDLYQTYYLNGLMAGALTRSGKVGYVAAHPIPEVVRHINAFALGVRAANPKAEVHIRWLFAWYDPAKAREAAEALVAEDCDALAFTEDSATVVQVAEEYTKKGKPVYSFSHYSPMKQFGPDSVVSGQLMDWTPLYEDILTKIHSGALTTNNLQDVDYFWLMREGVAQIGTQFREPINPKFANPLKAAMVGNVSAYDLVFQRIDEMKALTFDPFTGPIKDNTGTLRLKDGQRATLKELTTIDWFVEGVAGKVPR